MAAKLLVAFRTRAVAGYTPDMSEIVAPASYKDPEKINQWLNDKNAKMMAAAADQPFTGTFEEVQIADVKNRKVGSWKYNDPAGGKPSIAQRVRAWLLAAYPTAWSHSVGKRDAAPEAIFIGFDTRLFLKMLGTECLRLPAPLGVEAVPDPSDLPLSLWCENSDHRDLDNLLRSEAKTVSWATVLGAIGLADKHKNWGGPHVDAVLDLELIRDLSIRMGMMANEVKDEM